MSPTYHLSHENRHYDESDSAYMFIIQVVANYKSSQNTCIFCSEYRDNQHYALLPTLEFPTQVLVVVNILNGVVSPLINITVLEFISAQSPHTMKGLLLGVFYAFRCLFITLGCVATFPFAVGRPSWHI